jgi:GTP-binding protein
MPATVAIIGRPNVGKSTLFNRLLRREAAITHDRPGVTRDRIYAETDLDGRKVAFVDTGGLEMEEQAEDIQAAIFAQAREAVKESHGILLVMDGREGLTALDERVAAFIRTSNKPVLLAVNKIDGSENADLMLAEFHGLGFPLLAVSASHGHGITTLREQIADFLLADVPEEEDLTAEQGLRIAFLGKPNAGKSSLVNSLTGSDRVIVSPVAGTTRDSVDVTFEVEGKRYTFVDTAGVRKRTKIEDNLEQFSVLRALKASKKAQITVLVLDAQAGMTTQDKKLLSFLEKEKTPFIAVINKMDLVPRDERKVAREHYKKELSIASYAPVTFTSALTGVGVAELLPMAERLLEECRIRIGTGALNRALRAALGKHQPPVVKRRRAKFYYLTQVETEPPTFVFFVNDPELIKPSYARYLENSLRKLLGITMAPVRVFYKPSHDKKSE